MELPSLPPDWVEILNDMAYSRSVLDPEDERLQTVLIHLRAWYAFESAYSIHAEDQQMLDNLKVLIEELESARDHGEPALDLDYVAPRMFQLVRLMEAVQAGRARAHYSPQPLINDAVLAGAAWIEGRAQDRALSERSDRLQVWRDQLWSGYRELAAELPEAIRSDLELGFEMLDDGLAELAEAGQRPDRQALKPGLAQLVEGAGLVQFLIDFRQQSLQQLAQRYPRWEPIPQVGPAAERAFQVLEGLAASARPEYWQEQLRPLWIELSFWWGQHRDRLPLPADFAAAWIPEVEELLGTLAQFEAAELARGRELSEVEEIVDELAAGFAEAREKLAPVEHLRGGQAGVYYELIVGLLGNTQPVVAVPELFHSLEPPASWQPVVDDILNYTKGGSRELLYQAREKLWTLVPPPSAGAGPEFWTCPFCQQQTPLGVTVCQHCGGGSSVSREVAAWDA